MNERQSSIIIILAEFALLIMLLSVAAITLVEVQGQHGDFNGDGEVDLVDLSILADRINRSNTQSSQ